MMDFPENSQEIKLAYHPEGKGWETTEIAPIETGEILANSENQKILSNGGKIVFDTVTESGEKIIRTIDAPGNSGYLGEQQKNLDRIDSNLLTKIEPVLNEYQEKIFELFNEDRVNYEELHNTTVKFYEFLLAQSYEVDKLITKKLPTTTIQNLREVILLEKRQKKLNRFRKDFSHDFCRGPFASILSMLNGLYLEPEIFKEYAEEFNEIIKEGVGGMSELLINVLALSQKPEFKKVKEAEISKGEWSVLNSRAKSKGIKLVLDIEEDIQIFSDVRFIMEMIRNLVSNSIKFQDKGEIVISLRSKADKTVELVVRDNGSGINGENLQQIQKMIKGGGVVNLKSHHGTKDEKGTGHGISAVINTSREIFIKNGDISVETSEKGTTFVIILPTEETVLKLKKERVEQEEVDVSEAIKKRSQLHLIELNNTFSQKKFYLKEDIHPRAYALSQKYYANQLDINKEWGRVVVADGFDIIREIEDLALAEISNKGDAFRYTVAMLDQWEDSIKKKIVILKN